MSDRVSTEIVWPKLAAYCVKVDESISADEIDKVHSFFESIEGIQAASRLFTAFRSELTNEIVISDVVEEFERADLSGSDKIEVILDLYGLFASDGLTDQELTLFQYISSSVSVPDDDIDLITSLAIDRYEYRFSGNEGRKLVCSESSDSADIYMQGVLAEIVKLSGGVFIFNKRSSVPLFVDGVEIPNSQSAAVSAETVIRTASSRLRGSHVETIFSHRERNPRSLRLDLIGNALVPSESDSPDLVCFIERGKFRIYPKFPQAFAVNGMPVSESVFVNLDDSLTLTGEISGRVPLPAIFVQETRGNHLLISEGEPVIRTVSSTDSNSDVFIDVEGISIELTFESMEGADSAFTVSGLESDLWSWNGSTVESSASFTVYEPGLLTSGAIRIWVDPVAGSVEQAAAAFDDFSVDSLVYDFPSGRRGIDDVSFSVESGTMTAIMGASGAGKSTLLRLLLGYARPTDGRVLVNGVDFYQAFSHVRKLVGYVPQDDLLRENLTVYQNLYYASRIRDPHLSRGETHRRVVDTLEAIGLLEKQSLRVGSPARKVLSGGQRKRLNIGMELVSDPALFFLDEPTSGLSSRDSQRVVSTLEMLARKGKIIFVVIHQPSGQLYSKFDNLLLLDVGGKCVYFGEAQNAIDYFEEYLPEIDRYTGPPESRSPDVIFDVLEEQRVGPDGRPVYSAAKTDSRKIFGIPIRSAATPSPVRRRGPEHWRTLYQTRSGDTARPEVKVPRALPPVRPTRTFDQLKVLGALTAREFMDKVRSSSTLVLTLVAPPLLAVLLGALFRGNQVPYLFSSNQEVPKFLFLATIAFIFFGLMASVTEIVRDRPLLMREKLVNIRPVQYLTAKTFVFLLFVTVQAIFFARISFAVLEIPNTSGMVFEVSRISAPVVFTTLVLIATAFSAYGLGLLISALLNSESAASNIVPLVIIPQILLGGLLLDFEQMPRSINDHVPWYSNLTTARWSYEALHASLLDTNELFIASSVDRLERYTERSGNPFPSQDNAAAAARERLLEMRGRVSVPVLRPYSESVFETEVADEIQYYRSLDDYDVSLSFEKSGDRYVPTEGASSETVQRVFSTVGFLTDEYIFSANHTLQSQVDGARTDEWADLVEDPAAQRGIDLLRGRNVFPSRRKVVLRMVLPTRLYNLWMLLGGGMFAIVGAAVALRLSGSD